MNDLYIITGNAGKLREAQTFFPTIKGLNVDLVEIQSIDSKEVIEYKLAEAHKHHNGQFIVEDTSLEIDTMHGLPGRFIKFFEKTIGLDGITNLTKLFGTNATALCTIGYFDGTTTHFFEGKIKGTITSQRGTNGFGWDKIFIPEGQTKTFSEMTSDEKNTISMRKLAFQQLLNHINSQ